MYRRGEAGTGTLILFIALLLVAAVAAAALIQTTNTMQQKALVTGAQATGIISSGVQVLSVQGTDGRTSVENCTVMLRLNAGSEPMQFATMFVQLSTKNSSTTYTAAATYTVVPANQTGTYNFTYVDVGSTHKDGMLVRGDLVELYLQMPRNLARGENIQIRFLPHNGMPTTVSFNAPDIMTNQYLNLYP